jgi:DNA-directed RNA polymerase subunit RPC12/RpoP
MPEVGDTVMGTAIGKSPRNSYRYVRCPDCGVERWTSNKITRITNKQYMRCNTCRLQIARVQIGARIRNGRGS